MADSNAVVEHREESDVNIQLEQRRSQVRGLEIQLTRKEAELRRAKEEQALLKELHAVNEVTLRKKQQKESDGAGSRLKIPRESLDEILRLEGEIKCANRRTVELQNEASTTSVQLNDVEKGIESICNRTALVKQVTGWISSGSQSSSVVGVSSEWIMRKKVLTELQDEQNAIKALTALLDKQAEFYTKRLEEQRTKDEEFAEAQRVLREKTVQYENLLGELKSFERLTKKKERLLDTASGKVTDDYKTVKMIEGDKKVLYANLSKLQETNVRNSKSILSLEMRLRQLETKLEAVNLFLQQVFADVEEEDEHIENIPEGATEVPLEQFEELCRELELSRATLLHREEQLNAGDAKVEQLERKTTILENAIASHAVSAQLQVKGKEREFETLMSHVDYMKAEFDEEYKRLTKENAALYVPAMAALHEEVRTRYHIAVCTRFVERVCVDTPSPTAEFIYKMALNENLKDITDVGTLPRVSLLQLNSLPCSLVLQVSSSRDVTQPLRPCLDTSEEEPILAAAFQKNLKTRLLRLVLSDGHSEVPAVELSTLSVFRSIPVPGEKLLVKEGAEIKNGAIIMTDDCVVPLGGGVQQLKKEVLIQQSRSDAPRFQPLRFGVSTPAGARAAAGPLSDSFDRDRGGNVGRARGRGLGYRGGRESGYRGQRPHNHHYNRPQ